jgi:hypothetical protein
MGTLIAGLCGAAAVSVVGWIFTAVCWGAIGFITGVISQAASGWRYFSYRIISFTYGINWSWWIPHPYIHWAGTY